MTNTVEIRVDGDRIDIEVEELSDLEQMIWAGKAPELLKKENVDEQPSDESVVEFLIDLTTSQTILTKELLDELPQDELVRLFNGVSVYSFDAGELPERGAERHRVEDKTIDFNENGSLDLDEWR